MVLLKKTDSTKRKFSCNRELSKESKFYEKRTREKKYSPEFKEGAVKLVIEQGQTILKAAEDLGINNSMLSKWIKRYRKAKTNLAEAFPSKGHLAPSDEKMRKLENELKRITMERDILKKAMAYFVERPK